MIQPHFTSCLLNIFSDSDSDEWTAVLAVLGVFILFIAIIGLIVAIFFLLTLQNTLKAIAPQNRKMRPGQVWLMLIPFFGIVWQFIVVSNIADSIESEYKSRHQTIESRPTYGIGLAMCILTCVGIIPFLRVINLAMIVCFIIYWVKVNEYKNKIPHLPNAMPDNLLFNDRGNPA